MNEPINHFDLTWLWSMLTGAASSLFTWFLARRRNNADALKSELDNVHNLAKMWRETAEKMNEDVNSLRKQVDGLYAKITQLLQDKERTEHENAELRQEMDMLQNQVNILKSNHDG
jgi:peptidoglycan hydrolase CwlO-like protein